MLNDGTGVILGGLARLTRNCNFDYEEVSCGTKPNSDSPSRATPSRNIGFGVASITQYIFLQLGSSETIRRAPLFAGLALSKRSESKDEDIVRTLWRHREHSRNICAA